MYEIHAFHKSGSDFVFNYIMKLCKYEKFELFSTNGDRQFCKDPNDYYNNNNRYKKNSVICPLRLSNDFKKYDANVIYIIHFRNPIDTLISEFYSYGYLHITNRNNKQFNEFRQNIQNIGIDMYCIQQLIETIAKYKVMFKWINENIQKNNVYISSYTEMKYNYPIWNKKMGEIFKLKPEIIYLLIKYFENQMNNKPIDNLKIIDGTIKQGHIRNGQNKQYLTELKPETIDIIKNEFNKIIPNYLKNKYKDFDL